MKRHLLHIVSLTTIVLLSVVLFACKKTELNPDSTTLVLKVRDDLGEVIPGNNVQVYVFNDSTDFRNAWQSGILGTAIYNGLLQNSEVTFTDLDHMQKYWILIEYEKDVNGSSVTLNNFFTQHELKNLLEEGAITTIRIDLSPFDTGNIAFYSTEIANQDNLSVEIFFDNVWVGTIDNLSSTAPTSVTDPNVLPVLYQTAGTHNFEAIGSNGCVWQGTVDIQAGVSFTAYNLPACDQGQINFWTPQSELIAHGNLTITLNDQDGVGQLTVGRATAPSNCEVGADILTVVRPTGKYVVHATSADGNCVWVKTLDLKEDCQNIPIEFSGCP